MKWLPIVILSFLWGSACPAQIIDQHKPGGTWTELTITDVQHQQLVKLGQVLLTHASNHNHVEYEKARKAWWEGCNAVKKEANLPKEAECDVKTGKVFLYKEPQ
jgi:hypothetical protein